MRGTSPNPELGDTPRGRLWAFRLLASIGLPLLFLISAEGALRLAGFGYDSDFLVTVPGHETLTTNQSFGWRFFPPTLARLPVVQELKSPKPAGRLRIAVLGGSAAMGMPEPSFAAPRQLESMLRRRHPDHDIEVVNAAMTAINSHVVREIAEDLAADGEIDLFVVYMGNNEVVGPWGAGTTLQPRGVPLSWIRASVELRELRFGQALEKLSRGLARRFAPAAEDAPARWRGMEMFANQHIATGDPRLKAVEDHLRANLRAILDHASSAEAPVLVSSVVSNLRDSPPFASATPDPDSLRDEARATWENVSQTDGNSDRICRIRAQGLVAEAFSTIEAAREELQQAVETFPEHAESWYRLGLCALASGDFEQAAQALRAARDNDTLRFRASSAINSALGEVAMAARDAGERVDWIDAEAALAPVAGPGGLPGDELFHEHVHLTFAGNHALAASWLPRVEALLPALGTVSPDVVPSLETVAEDLARTPWDAWRVAEDIRKVRAADLFTNQLDHDLRSERREETLRRLEAEARDPEILEQSERLYETILAARPDDLEVRARHASLLRHRGRPLEAAEELERLLSRIPDVFVWTMELGHARLDAGLWEAADAAYTAASALDPYSLDPVFNRGVVALRREAAQEALDRFDEVLAADSRHLQALVNRGAALDALDRLDEATEAYREATRAEPTSALAWFNLGTALARQGRTDEAIPAYETALEHRPRHRGARFNLALALEREGHEDESSVRYRELIASDPDFEGARTNLTALLEQRGARLAGAGDLPGALVAFREAAAVSPGRPEAHLNVAQVLAMTGDLDAAREEVSRALELAPTFEPARDLALRLDAARPRPRQTAVRGNRAPTTPAPKRQEP